MVRRRRVTCSLMRSASHRRVAPGRHSTEGARPLVQAGRSVSARPMTLEAELYPECCINTHLACIPLTPRPWTVFARRTDLYDSPASGSSHREVLACLGPFQPSRRLPPATTIIQPTDSCMPHLRDIRQHCLQKPDLFFFFPPLATAGPAGHSLCLVDRSSRPVYRVRPSVPATLDRPSPALV